MCDHPAVGHIFPPNSETASYTMAVCSSCSVSCQSAATLVNGEATVRHNEGEILLITYGAVLYTGSRLSLCYVSALKSSTEHSETRTATLIVWLVGYEPIRLRVTKRGPRTADVPLSTEFHPHVFSHSRPGTAGVQNSLGISIIWVGAAMKTRPRFARIGPAVSTLKSRRNDYQPQQSPGHSMITILGWIMSGIHGTPGRH